MNQALSKSPFLSLSASLHSKSVCLPFLFQQQQSCHLTCHPICIFFRKKSRKPLQIYWSFFPAMGWIQMSPSTVCFGAKDDSYGIFRTAISGNITTFKLTCQHGHVTCHEADPSYQSKWGCLWPPLIPNQMATLITDNDRNLLLPTNDYRSNFLGCTFYSFPWATTESPDLLFDNFSSPLMVESNQEFQIWFSEDLLRWGHSDNGLERTCVAVYGLYVWMAVIALPNVVSELSQKFIFHSK